MPSRKKQDAPSWQVILEDIRTQNRTTRGAVAAARIVLGSRVGRLDQESRARDAAQELAIRQNSLEIRELKAETRELKAGVQQNSLDIRELKAETGELKAGVQQNSLEIRE